MSSSMKKKCIVFLDLFTVAGQIAFAVGTTGSTLHYLDNHFKNSRWVANARESNWMFTPSIMWIGAGIVAIINLKGLKCTYNWFKEYDIENRKEEIEAITRSWIRWNIVCIGMSILWFFFFGLALIFNNKWPPLSALAILAVYLTGRSVIAGMVNKFYNGDGHPAVVRQNAAVVVRHNVLAENVEMQNLGGDAVVQEDAEGEQQEEETAEQNNGTG